MSTVSASPNGDVHYPQDDLPDIVDVLVVGAGPSGLATAIELRQFGISVAVVDRAVEVPLARSGAMGHTSRVAELFRRWGVHQQIRQSWTVPPEWHTGMHVVTSLTGHCLSSRGRSYFGGPEQSAGAQEAIRRPQTVVVNAFLRKLAELGVPVSGGWSWDAYTEDDQGATSSLTSAESGQRRVVRSSYVIGADGSGSSVRQAAGIQREGAYVQDRMYRFVARVIGDYPPEIGPFPSATNIVANQDYDGFLAALSDREWRLYYGPQSAGLPAPSVQELKATARRAFGAPVDVEIVAVHPFYPTKRIAERFRRGKALLVGDAAHVRAPGGNLGEGLGDVVNLGWKLALVLRGAAGESLLDSYTDERRPHNHRIADYNQSRKAQSALNLADARTLGFPEDQDVSADAQHRRQQIADLLKRGAGPSHGVVFDERYDESAVIRYDADQRENENPWNPEVYEDIASPGHRAPDGNIDPFGTRLYDRILDNFVLVVTEPEGVASADRFLRATRTRGVPLEVVYLFDEDVAAIYDRPLTLIRPDHHVAWRGLHDDPQEVLDAVLGAHVLTGNPSL